MKKVNIALLQQSYTEDMLQKTKSRVEEAAKRADLVLLSELHTSRYFCQDHDIGHAEESDLFSEHVKFFGNIAKQNSIVLVASLFEKRSRGLYHNTAVVFEKNGEIAGKYRKMHIPDDPRFHEKFYFAPGDLGFKPIHTSVGSLGVLICWDQWFPEAARIMAINGADILIYPTSIGHIETDSQQEKQRQLDAWITIQRSHSIANGLPLASINRAGFEGNENKAGDLGGIYFFGNSFVSGTQGEILVQAGTEEEILYATVDFDQIDKVRNMWPFFRDRRIDSYGDIMMRYRPD